MPIHPKTLGFNSVMFGRCYGVGYTDDET